MKKILLTKGLEALVDDDDFEWLNQFRWHASKQGSGKIYAKRTARKENGERSSTYMHREIKSSNNKNPTDHINGDTLDNRKENLRVVTPSLNCYNRKTRNKCVTYRADKKRRRWEAKISFNKKRYFLGYYLLEQEAMEAVAKKRQEIQEQLMEGHVYESAHQSSRPSLCGLPADL